MTDKTMNEVFETATSIEELAEALIDDAQIKLRLTKAPVDFLDNPKIMLLLSIAESSLATNLLLKALMDRLDALADGALYEEVKHDC